MADGSQHPAWGVTDRTAATTHITDEPDSVATRRVTAERHGAHDDLVTTAPTWLLGATFGFVALLVVTCFLVFWRGMGTAPRESAVEALGVAFGLLVAGSTVGALVQSHHDTRQTAARTPTDPNR